MAVLWVVVSMLAVTGLGCVGHVHAIQRFCKGACIITAFQLKQAQRGRAGIR